MRLSIAAGLVAATAAQAFPDSSPFVMLSTADLPSDLASSTSRHPPQLQTAKQVLQTARAFLSQCPTSRYVLVSQPGVHAEDVRALPGGALARHYAGAGKPLRGRWDVAEVVGDLSAASDLAGYVRAACHEMGRGGGAVSVEEHRLRAPPAGGAGRARLLAENDAELGKILDGLRSESDSYTVLYLSSPPRESAAYEPDFSAGEPVQMELRRRSRDDDVLVGRRRDGQRDNRPLFAKYQFFTPGIFMGLLAILTMLAVLYVGISALSSLEVSYGAFEKEMGPAAQKKNQ